MAKAIQTSNTNNRNKIVPNKKFDEYHDMFSLRLKPVPDAFIDQVAENLVRWALTTEDALILKEFYVLQGMNSTDMKRWCERNENLKRAHQFALMVLGIKREKGALTRKLDAGMVASSMAHYCEDWKALAEWRSALTKTDDQKSQEIHVHLDGIPSSPLVPEKKGK